MVMFSDNNYYHAMDSFSKDDVITPLTFQEAKDEFTLSTKDIGTTTNPMGNTLASLGSRIREGAGKIEFEFVGHGKGNSQQSTPESYGQQERQDMRELLTINNVKSSVHASVHGDSLAGAGREGFSGAQRQQSLVEINRAIDFAGDVTDGGAIVFHLSEWQRPLTHAGMDPLKRKDNWMFKGYDSEEKDSPLIVVDKRTGKFIQGLTKDTVIYEPVYETGKDHPNKIGKKDAKGVIVKEDDWLDINGNVIPKNAPSEDLFNRVPVFDKDKTNFKVEARKWDYFVTKAKEYNELHKEEPITPEEMYAKTKYENQVLQYKGNSLFHAMNYEGHKKQAQKLQESLKFYEALEKDATPEEREQLRKQYLGTHSNFATPDNMLPTEAIKQELKLVQDHMKHTHESSASADVQATEMQEIMKNIDNAERYGLQKTAETIAQVGMNAMETTQRKKLKNPLYAAPENYDQHLYGSHPEELRAVITKSREVMAKQLLERNRAGSQKEAMEIASKHIKATLDIGHMNMWRQYFDPIDEKGNKLYNTHAEREKAFNKWILTETEKLAKEGIVGHVHLTDNMGYGDEHLSPGQGNTPIKEFMKKMQEHGVTDMIVEPGSFNATTAWNDTLAMVDSPIYGIGGQRRYVPRFASMHNAHLGYNAPGFFIAGAYAPSNDWRPWTEIPLE